MARRFPAFDGKSSGWIRFSSFLPSCSIAPGLHGISPYPCHPLGLRPDRLERLLSYHQLEIKACTRTRASQYRGRQTVSSLIQLPSDSLRTSSLSPSTAPNQCLLSFWSRAPTQTAFTIPVHPDTRYFLLVTAVCCRCLRFCSPKLLPRAFTQRSSPGFHADRLVARLRAYRNDRLARALALAFAAPPPRLEE